MIRELWLGDCLKLMRKIPSGSVNAIICDLPYGTTACKWDQIIPFDKLWKHYTRVIKDNGSIILFGKEPFSSLLRSSNLPMFKYDWIWRKDTKSNFPQANFQPLNNIEMISVFSKAYARAFPKNDNKHISMKYNPQMIEGEKYKLPKSSKTTAIFSTNHKNGIYRHSHRDTSKRFPYNLLDFNTDKDKFHPTQKPLSLIEYLILTYSDKDDLILDNCMGSGTTCLGADNLGRQFIGIEKEKEYYDICLKRLKFRKKTQQEG